MELTYHEVADKLDKENIDAKSTVYTFPRELYEFSDINLMLKSSFPDEVKVKITIDDIRLRSNLTTHKSIRFTKKSFFLTILGFIQSHLRELDEIERFIKLIPGTYKSDKPINLTGIDKFPLKCDCINGSIVNGTREPFLYSFAHSSPTSHKINNQPRIKLFEKHNKPVLSPFSFHVEDDDHKRIHSNGETVSFTCQLIKISKINEPKQDST